MDETDDRARLEVDGLQQDVDALGHAVGGSLGPGRHLGYMEAVAIPADYIGEGSAEINSDREVAFGAPIPRLVTAQFGPSRRCAGAPTRRRASFLSKWPAPGEPDAGELPRPILSVTISRLGAEKS